MKYLTLLNPPRRRRATRRARSARRVSRRRVTRRNPPKMTPAMRAKISRAVKAANRRRGTTKVRRSSRRSLVRRSHPPRMTPAMRRKVGLGVRRANAARRGGLRRFSGGGGGGGVGVTLKNMLSKDVLMIGVGAVGSGLLTNIVLSRWGASLPMANSNMGSIGYRLLIPFAGAFAVKRFNRKLAEGMMIGGVVMALNETIRIYFPQVTQIGVPQNISAPLPGAVGEYLGAPVNASIADAVNTYGASVYDSQPAFKDDAWS